MVMKHQVFHQAHKNETPGVSTPGVSSGKYEPRVITKYLFMKVRVSNTDTHHRERAKDLMPKGSKGGSERGRQRGDRVEGVRVAEVRVREEDT